MDAATTNAIAATQRKEKENKTRDRVLIYVTSLPKPLIPDNQPPMQKAIYVSEYRPGQTLAQCQNPTEFRMKRVPFWR